MLDDLSSATRTGGLRPRVADHALMGRLGTSCSSTASRAGRCGSRRGEVVRLYPHERVEHAGVQRLVHGAAR